MHEQLLLLPTHAWSEPVARNQLRGRLVGGDGEFVGTQAPCEDGPTRTADGRQPAQERTQPRKAQGGGEPPRVQTLLPEQLVRPLGDIRPRTSE